LRELWELYRTKRSYRLHNDGTGGKKAKDLGPLTMEARWEGLYFLDDLQDEIYRLGGTFQIIKPEERERIFQHWHDGSWPEGWDGTQPVGNARQLIPVGQTEFELFGE
jgi:hypothetical protein